MAAPTDSMPDVRVEPASEKDAGELVAGRYRLLERLGDGAMGSVYLAEHEALHRRVALKFLHETFTGNTEIAARFAREAVAAARIDHPNVIAVYDSGTDERGRCFLAMEYCRGEELRAALHRDGVFPRGRTVGIARQIAAALDHAHSLGIVHRDIKPENVLLVRRDDGVEAVKVIDFGIARVFQPEATGQPLTRAGIVLGTPEYMAPEQALGIDIDHRVDLYAFAVTVYEMLVGRRPFDHEDLMAVLMKHINAPPPPPSTIRPEAGLSPAVDAVFAKALAKAPGDRYPTAAAFVDALADALNAPAATPSLALPPQAHAVLARADTLARDRITLVTARWRVLPTRVRHGIVGAVALLTVTALAWPRHPTVTPATTGVLPAAHRHAPRATPGTAPATGVLARIETLRAQPDFSTATPAARHRTALALEAMRASAPDDAAVAYLLGDLYARNPNTGAQSLAAYRDALRAAPELATDDALVDDVVRVYASSPALAAPAEAMLRATLADAARPELVEVCLRGSAGHARAATLLAGEPFVGHLDATERHVVALWTARDCEGRRDAVAALGRDGDARALPALRKVATGRGCGFMGLGRCNTCMGTSVADAVHAIEARSDGGTAP